MYAAGRLRPGRLRRGRGRARRAAAAARCGRATRCSGWPAAACTPTGSPWCGASCGVAGRAGPTPAPFAGRDPGAGADGADPALREAGAGAAPGRAAAGGGAHHRRRPAGQPAARAAGRRARGDRPAPGRCRRCSPGWRGPGRWRRRRCCGCSTAASAWCWWSRPAAATALLEEQGETAFTIGRLEAGDGEADVGSSAGLAAVGGVRRRVGILISGRGSNMARCCTRRRARLSRRDRAGAVEPAGRRRAGAGAAAGVAALCVDHRPFGGDRAAHEAAIDAALRGPGSSWSAWPATCGC